MSRLFEPLSLGPLTLANRIVVAPMCQYSAVDGTAGDWHLIHLGHLALSGAGLLMLEATAVSPEGRISPQDLGLYSDANEAALARILAAIRAHAPTIKVAIQLGHAGRKGSSRAPWDGGTQIASDAPGGWHAEAPSALPHAESEQAPRALDAAGLARVKQAFADAARRAARLGLDGIELHAAHGYLFHEFLSPISNKRTDEYGGSLENRSRLLRRVTERTRATLLDNLPLFVRISATDWIEGGWDVDESVALARMLKTLGADLIDVSSGGISLAQQVRVGPGYQVPFAERIRREAAIPTAAVGLIAEAEQADEIIRSGKADAALIARASLRNPYWPIHAARKLGQEVIIPFQYLRGW
jgi:2,4-dienoyl-CoA reductase-like NADH-dependent reductase (Old Yellow Enzyme family)